MNMRKDDMNIRTFFDELKERDAERLPPFDAVVTAHSRPTSPSLVASLLSSRVPVGLAAGLILATLVILTVRWRSSSSQMQQWAALSTWTAPTDSLLEVNLPWSSTLRTPTDLWLRSFDLDTTKKSL